MRSINWSSIESSSEGGFARIEPGAYACTITSVEDFPDREYARMLVDVAEGPRRGYFADGFYADKPYAHGLIMSYKDTALGMLKGRLETIQSCNPGFDPFAAWDAGRLDMFAGRRVGVVFREEEYWDKREEEFKVGSARPWRLCKLEDVPTTKAPEPKMLDDEGKVKALIRAGYGELEARAKMDGTDAKATAAADDLPDVPF